MLEQENKGEDASLSFLPAPSNPPFILVTL